MARPKSPDPKRAVTLRLPSSVVERYEAMGEGWRARMEAVIVGEEPGDAWPADMRVRLPTAYATAPSFGPRRAAPGSRLKKR